MGKTSSEYQGLQRIHASDDDDDDDGCKKTCSTAILYVNLNINYLAEKIVCNSTYSNISNSHSLYSLTFNLSIWHVDKYFRLVWSKISKFIFAMAKFILLKYISLKGLQCNLHNIHKNILTVVSEKDFFEIEFNKICCG